MTVKMSQLGITRRQLETWASECGLMLIDKPDPVFDESLTSAQADDLVRFPDGISVVYFLREEGLGRIKIGTSKQPRKRVAELARILPSEVTLLATIKGDRETEWVIQKRFETAHVRGEWYHPAPELFAYIEEIKVSDAAQ